MAKGKDKYMGTRILDSTGQRVGTFLGASAPPPAGSSSATVAAVMAASEAADPTNTLRVGVEADFGAGFRHMLWGGLWTGGPGQTATSVAWHFDPNHPPLRVRGVLENVTQVDCGLAIAFA